MICSKLNESFFSLEASPEELQPIIRRLRVDLPNAYFDPLVRRGIKKSYVEFYHVHDKKLIVSSGLIPFLKQYNVNYNKESDFTETDIDEYLKSVNLPFEPYDYQLKALYDSVLNKQQINLMCTGSGKSLTISLIADFFRKNNLKGLLIVPNINLLTQFKNDILQYNLNDLYEDTHVIGGENKIKHFNKGLTISTYQSLMNFKEKLHELDYVLCDEAHRAKGEQIQDITNKSINASYRLGFTGTLPDVAVDRMSLFCLFGAPVTYIKTNGLVKLGLATPVNINVIKFQYSPDDKALFRHTGNYTKQLQFIKEHENRTLFISKLSLNLSGNSLVLFQHKDHGKTIFQKIMNIKYPDVQVQNKDITGKKSFEFQKKYGVYFINGEIEGKTREDIRNILEIDKNSILVAGYQVLSTGVNIKNLHNLIFASPMKSFTTISQSIGRGVRQHVSKDVFNVFDLADEFTPKGTFMKQLNQRVQMSYNTEDFPIVYKNVNI